MNIIYLLIYINYVKHLMKFTCNYVCNDYKIIWEHTNYYKYKYQKIKIIFIYLLYHEILKILSDYKKV